MPNSADTAAMFESMGRGNAHDSELMEDIDPRTAEHIKNLGMFNVDGHARTSDPTQTAYNEVPRRKNPRSMSDQTVADGLTRDSQGR